jgi:hypothetical protein
MASYRRSFNFRNGVQVDEDNFIVTSTGLVGIGTSVPTEFLDVRGNAVISGSLTVDSISATNLQNQSGDFTTLNIGVTSITSGIISASSGVVTYYGDGGNLLNLPTSQWLDADVGLGFTSIYSQGNVGIATTDPRFAFQIGGNNSIASFVNGIGINNKGDILATGVVTARSFVGYGSGITLIDASNISSGTLNNSRLASNISVSGIITANTHFRGNLVGIASTAISLVSTSNIFVNSINSGFSTSGISTITNKLHVEGNIGVGTLNPNVDIHVRKNGSAAIQITSDGSNSSRFVIGRDVSLTTNNAELEFGNTDTGYPDSTQTSFDISNYSTGNLNYYLHLGSSGLGTGSFNWIYGQSLSRLMTLTYGGNLGIGLTNPSRNLHVVGTSTITGDSYFGGNVYLSGGIIPSTLSVTNTAIFNSSVGIGTTLPTYLFQIGKNPINVDGGIGINLRGDIYTAGIITAKSFVGYGSDVTLIRPSNIASGTINSLLDINTVGVITATRFSGNGSTLTNLSATNMTSGTLGGSVNVNTTGVATATRFSGNGSTLTNLNASNINSGTLENAISVNTTGIITATRFSGNGSTLTNLNVSNVSGTTLDTVSEINVTGITTSETGFTSGIGTAVQILTIGNKIRFVVPGVGNVELTLT